MFCYVYVYVYVYVNGNCHGMILCLGVAKLCSLSMYAKLQSKLMPCVTVPYLYPVLHLILQTFDESFVIGSLYGDFSPVLHFVK